MKKLQENALPEDLSGRALLHFINALAEQSFP